MSPCRSNSVIPQEKQNGSEKDRQAIPYKKDEVNKSIEENGSKTIEQKASEQKKIARNQIAYIPHLKYLLNNVPTSSLSNTFGRNNSNQISISTADKLDDTNHTSMEQLSLLEITIG